MHTSNNPICMAGTSGIVNGLYAITSNITTARMRKT